MDSDPIGAMGADSTGGERDDPESPASAPSRLVQAAVFTPDGPKGGWTLVYLGPLVCLVGGLGLIYMLSDISSFSTPRGGRAVIAAAGILVTGIATTCLGFAIRRGRVVVEPTGRVIIKRSWATETCVVKDIVELECWRAGTFLFEKDRLVADLVLADDTALTMPACEPTAKAAFYQAVADHLGVPVTGEELPATTAAERAAYRAPWTPADRFEP